MAEVAAIILAAGTASRFAKSSALVTKLVAPYRGQPMIARVVQAALASRARPIVVVTGHARAEVEAALQGLPVTLVHNAGFASGLAGSLQAGIAHVPAGCTGALVLLGDMPQVSAATCDRLIDAYGRSGETTKALVPVWQERTGNPLLLARRMFGEITQLQGDQGARRLVPDGSAGLVLVEVADAGILADADTPEALAALQDSTD